MCRCMDAAGLQFVYCKLYSLFHLDYHSTGALIQNKENKDNCRRQRGRFYRRERGVRVETAEVLRLVLSSLISSRLPLIFTLLALHIL